MINRPKDIAYGGLNQDRIINAQTTVNLENLKHLYQFIIDRYTVHLNKDVYGLPKPWTDNPILREYKFTNVRREHDRTTKYLIKQLEEHKDDSYANIWCNIIAFRLFNKVETYELLGGWIDFVDINVAKVKRQLESAPKGFVYFTNAFYTTGMRQGMARTCPGITLEPLRIIRSVHKSMDDIVFRINGAQHPKDICAACEVLDGIGSFLSYQMFVDFTYLPDFPWSENEFVIAGPGCVEGLKCLYDDWGGLSANELMFQMRDNINAIFKMYVNPDWDPKNLMIDLPMHDRKLNVMSLENCMCELSKYIRAVTGTGRPKNKYKGV